MNKKIIFFIAFGLLAALPASAAIIPPCATGSGVPQLSCFLELAVSVSKWILGITGSLAILFFVYGGFMFLTSRGSEQQITKGKTILTQAAIGIIIIFGAYVGVSFLTTAIGGKFSTEFKIEQPVNPTVTEYCGACYCKDSQLKIYHKSQENSKTACKSICEALPDSAGGGVKQSFAKCETEGATKPTCVCQMAVSSEKLAIALGQISINIEKICLAAGGKFGSSQQAGATAFACNITSVTDASACSAFQNVFSSASGNSWTNCTIGTTTN